MSPEQAVGHRLAPKPMAGPRIATPFERLDARFADAFLGAGVLGVLFAVALLWTGDLAAAQLYAPLSAIVVLPSLEAICVLHRGATPGKALKRMRIASLYSATGAPTYVQALGRAAVLQALALSLFLWWPLVFVYILTVFTNQDRRGLHDMVAGTIVIRDRG